MSRDSYTSDCPLVEAGRILVVDDEPAFVNTLGEVLATAGLDAETTTDPREALEWLAAGEYALLITDLVMPGLDGMELLRRARAVSPGTDAIVVTGYGTVETAVEAIRAGAADFLTKPFESRRIIEVIGRVAELRRLRRENQRLRAELAALRSEPPGEGPAAAAAEAPGPDGPSRRLADVEREAIRAALARSKGNISRAARDLGVSRTSLYDRMERYGLPRPARSRKA